MSSPKKKRKQQIPEQPLSAWTYLLVSGIGLIISVGLLLLFIFRAPLLIANGIDGRVFYFLLIPLGLASASFIFGAMRSYGRFSGRMFSGFLEMGGPITGASLVVLGGFLLVPQAAATFNVTVRVFDTEGKTINKGSLTLYIEQDARRAPIASNGEANIKEIPIKFRNASVMVDVDVEGYRIKDNNQSITLSDPVIRVELEKEPSTFQRNELRLEKLTLASSNYHTVANHEHAFVQQENMQSNRLILNIGLSNQSAESVYITNVRIHLMNYSNKTDFQDSDFLISKIRIVFKTIPTEEELQTLKQKYSFEEIDHFDEMYNFSILKPFTVADLQLLQKENSVRKVEIISYGTGYADILPSSTVTLKSPISPITKTETIDTDKVVAPHGAERFEIALNFAKAGTYVLQGSIGYGQEEEISLPLVTAVIRH